MNILCKNILVLFFCLFSSAAMASGPGFNDTDSQPLTSNTNPNFSVNVGIGSTAPSGALDVGSGSICLGHTCNSTWPSGGANYWSLTAGAGNVGISTTNTVGIGTTAGVGAGLVVMNGNVGIGTWNPNGGVIIMNGNVGVGSISPSGILDVIGSAGIAASSIPGGGINLVGGIGGSGSASGSPGGSLTLTAGAGRTGGLHDSVGGNVTITAGQGGSGNDRGNGGNVTINPGAAGSGVTGNVVIANSNGNVGVGTTIPSSLLDVNRKFNVLSGGNVGIGSIAPNGALDVGSGSICLGHTCNSSWPSSGSNYWLNTAGAGNVGISTTNTVGIGTTSAGAGAGLVVMNGNVGIGTWVPQYPFVVIGNSDTIGRGPLYISSTNINAFGSGVSLDATAAGGKNYEFSSTGSGGYNSGGFTVYSSTDSAYRLSISSAGNTLVGVIPGPGQVSASQLGVNGNASIGSGYFQTAAPSDGMIIQGNVGIGTAAPVGGLAVMNGNVGIGTWIPVGQLHTVGAISDNNKGGGLAFQTNSGIRVYDAVNHYGTWFSASSSDGYTPNADGTWNAWNDYWVNYYSNGNLHINDANGSSPGYLTVAGKTSLGIDATPINTLDVRGNVIIGTLYANVDVAPTNGLAVRGNVGIGTFIANDSLIIASGNIGVGSLTPNGALDVGTGAVCINHVCNSSWPSGGGTNYWSLTAGAGNIGISTTNTVGIGTTSAGAGAGLVVMNGNVGIGTWAPQSLLQLSGPSGVSAITLNTPGTENIRLQTIPSVNNWGAFTLNANFQSGGWNLDTTSDNGWFFKLDTRGGAGYSSNNGMWVFRVPNGANPHNGDEYAVFGVTNGGTSIRDGLSIGTSYLATQPPTNGAIIQGNVGIGTTIPLGGLSVMNGNVGIGTWIPAQLLDVNGASQFGGNLVFNADNAYNIGSASGSAGGRPKNIYVVNSLNVASTVYGSGFVSYACTNCGNFYMNNAGTDYGAIGNNATNEWYLGYAGSNSGSVGTPVLVWQDLTGNVGINSTAPGQKLDVQGTVRMTGFNLSGTTSSGNVLTSDANGNGTWQAGGSGSNFWLNTAAAGNVGISTTNTVGIGTTSAGTGAGLVVMNGNVGIGTWSPGEALIVRNGNVGIGTSSASGSQFYLYSPTAAELIDIRSDLSNGNSQIRLRTDTGTVAGNIVSNSGAANSTFATVPQSYAIRIKSGGTGGLILGAEDTAASIIFYQGGNAFSNEKMRIIPGGNVGIGTTTPLGGLVVMNGNLGIGTWVPSAALQVVGNVGIGTSVITTTVSIKGSFSQLANTLTPGATVATDVSTANYFRLTANQSFTLSNPSNPTDAQRVVWEIIQPASGGPDVMTLGSQFALGTDITACTLTTTASKRDFMTAIYNASQTKWYVVACAHGY